MTYGKNTWVGIHHKRLEQLLKVYLETQTSVTVFSTFRVNYMLLRYTLNNLDYKLILSCFVKIQHFSNFLPEILNSLQIPVLNYKLFKQILHF
jgi:hypothetical protein